MVERIFRLLFLMNEALDRKNTLLLNRLCRDQKYNFGAIQSLKMNNYYINLSFLRLRQDQFDCAGNAKNKEDGD